jgi:hypothetical protein
MACEIFQDQLAELVERRTEAQLNLQSAQGKDFALLKREIDRLNEDIKEKQAELADCLSNTPELPREECVASILVVTDNLNFEESNGFGLTDFVEALRSVPIGGMIPVITTALFNPNPAAVLTYDDKERHVRNFKFTDATYGLEMPRYKVVFILAINGQMSDGLANEAGALAAITVFMQNGGGVFATGDHADLGAAMCKDIPRVRNMRRWVGKDGVDVPSASGKDRITTNLPGRSDVAGSNDVYEIVDQQDQFPQRLFVNYLTVAGGDGAAHPVLQIPAANRAIEVFPDHPHEGECIIPTDLTTKLADGSTDEWPADPAGNRILPEMVALTMSHGNGADGKAPVVPRAFIAIAAYDGQLANVGRVITDATWHHFVNINIKPGFSQIGGRDLIDIHQYYRNLATWLMPKSFRMCARVMLIRDELRRFPLAEELPPLMRNERSAAMMREIGGIVEAALTTRHTRAEVAAIVDDALNEVLDPDAKRSLVAVGTEFAAIPRETGLVVLGSLAMAVAGRGDAGRLMGLADDETTSADSPSTQVANGVELYLSGLTENIKNVTTIVETARRRMRVTSSDQK